MKAKDPRRLLTTEQNEIIDNIISLNSNKTEHSLRFPPV